MIIQEIEKIIWQPITLTNKGEDPVGYDFGIVLDKEFAIKMLSSEIPTEKQKRLNELAIERVFNWYKCTQLTPYYFYGDTALITQFNLNLGNGEWLALDAGINRIKGNNFSTDKDFILYSSHNIDFPSSSHALMTLFELWIDHYDILIEK